MVLQGIVPYLWGVVFTMLVIKRLVPIWVRMVLLGIVPSMVPLLWVTVLCPLFVPQ